MSDAISKVKRYDLLGEYDPLMLPCDDGDYVRYDDVVEALQSGEPVAVRYGFDGYGYLYLDGGSGSDWMTRIPDAEKLYAAPQLETTKPVAYWNKNFTFASFIKLADHIEGEPPNGWVPLYTTPQPVSEDARDAQRFRQLEDIFAGLKVSRSKNVLGALGFHEADPYGTLAQALLSAGKGGE